MKRLLVLLLAVCASHALIASAWDSDGTPPLKVLMVGNSFSRSVIWETPQCARSAGKTLDLVSLCIGGCPLEKHVASFEIAQTNADFRPYRLEWNYGSVANQAEAAVARLGKKANLLEALKADRWDVVTIQQASGKSIDYATYQPFADKLVAKIRELAPQAEIVIQQTWSYTPYDPRLFGKGTPAGMYARLERTYDRLSGTYGFRQIPTGLAVQLFRARLPVDYGTLLTPEELKVRKEAKTIDFHSDVCGSNEWKDLTHFNDRGNYLQGLVWTAALFGVDPSAVAYRPRGIPERDAQVMRDCVREALRRKTGVTLDGGDLAIRFGGENNGFAILSLENRLADNVRFGVTQGTKPDFWELVFTADGGKDSAKSVRLDNRAPCVRYRVKKSRDGLVFHWDGLTVPGGTQGAVDVRADVTLTDAATAEWKLYVRNRDPKWTLFSTCYPCIRQVVEDGTADVLIPGRNLGGRLAHNYDTKKEWRHSWAYPSLYPMVTAFMRGDAGLYVAAHDGEARLKSLSLAPGCDLSFQTVVENAGVSGKAAEGPRYAVTTAAFRGDWWQAAKRYRAWALRQRWCAKGRIADRTDWPQAMTDVDAWLVASQNSPEEVRERLSKAREFYPDLRLGVHWYGWNGKQGLSECPYFTPGPGAKETIDLAKSLKILLMPYVDGRLQSKTSARFAAAKEEACRAVDGGFIEENWGGKSPYVVMCPWAPDFSKAVFENATNVVFGLDFDAIYEDQIACSRGWPCFDARHGHPVGGGTWWADGYRRILGPLHKLMAAKNRPITSEQSCETWLDLIDGYLLAESPRGDDVPFYMAVYGGYATYFGARINYEKPLDYFAVQARQLVWGVAPNWQRLNKQFIGEERPDAVSVLGRMARIRKTAAAFLKYGTLEDELRIKGDVPKRRVEWLGADGDQWGKPFAADFPTAFGTVWHDFTGARTAVFAVNICTGAKTVRFESVFADDPAVMTVEGEGMPILRKSDRMLELEIPANGVAILTGRAVIPVETAEWQRAIDACAARGGGLVTVPRGRHLVGQLNLRSNVELHLEEGSVLAGVTGIENYRPLQLSHTEGDLYGLVTAAGVTNVAITGSGLIFGDGMSWPQPDDYCGNQEGLRPRGLVFADSRDIRLEDFTLRDAPCWGIVLKCCDGVKARNVRVDSHANANNDGFDIEARNVLIENCFADTEDDAFCLKSNDPAFVMTNVVIRNCIGRSQCNAFKLGTASHGIVRQVRIEHCRAEAPSREFVDRRPHSRWFGRAWFAAHGHPDYPNGVGFSAIAIENVDGGEVCDYRVDDVEVSGYLAAFFIRGGARFGRSCGTEPGRRCVFRGISVSNVRGSQLGPYPSSVTGVDGCRPENVILRNIDIFCPGASLEASRVAMSEAVPSHPGSYPEVTASFAPSILPAYGLYADKVKALVLDNVKFALCRESEDCRPAICDRTSEEKNEG